MRMTGSNFKTNFFKLESPPVHVKTKNNLLVSHLASDVFVNQMVLAFVVEDDMNLLCAGATNVRT